MKFEIFTGHLDQWHEKREAPAQLEEFQSSIESNPSHSYSYTTQNNELVVKVLLWLVLRQHHKLWYAQDDIHAHEISLGEIEAEVAQQILQSYLKSTKIQRMFVTNQHTGVLTVLINPLK